jgi:signal-transduction protein with cAMP-binding, CBS, and nucleotidyltransferase domain
MTIDEPLSALRRIAPFDRMPDDQLALLLTFATIRDYSPGATVHKGINAPPRLQVVMKGCVVDAAGTAMGPVMGLTAMFEPPSQAILSADASGATILSIDRQTFFTLARARPEFVRGFLEIGTSGGVASP